METQILLSLQHPHIIKIRGYATQGQEGYCEKSEKSGSNTELPSHKGYFLILDQLPVSMEARLVSWRKRLKELSTSKRSLLSKGRRLLRRTDTKKPTTSKDEISRAMDDLLQERYQVAYDICGAMEYLHDRRMMNRDLKTANLGFDVRGDVKLFDFGVSRWLPPSLLLKEESSRNYLDETFHMSCVGTRLYMAPEVRYKQPYSTKADVYSFGIVLWEMLCLSDPIWNHGTTTEHQVLSPVKMPICPCWPNALLKILQSCLSMIPKERPSFTELRQFLIHELDVVEEDEQHQLDGIGSLHSTMQRNGSLKSLLEKEDGDEVRSMAGGGLEDDDADDDDDGIADGDMALPSASHHHRRRRSTFVLNFTDLSWLSSGHGSSSMFSTGNNDSTLMTAGTDQKQKESSRSFRFGRSSSSRGEAPAK